MAKTKATQKSDSLTDPEMKSPMLKSASTPATAPEEVSKSMDSGTVAVTDLDPITEYVTMWGELRNRIDTTIALAVQYKASNYTNKAISRRSRTASLKLAVSLKTLRESTKACDKAIPVRKRLNNQKTSPAGKK